MIVGAADVYISDFGVLEVVPNRFQRGRDAFILDFDHVKLRWLRPIRKEKLAKTGDADKSHLIGEFGLEVSVEKAHGLIADLTTA